MGKEEKKFEELYNALKNAAYVFCFNAAGDEDCPSNGPCPYAWTDEDGILHLGLYEFLLNENSLEL